MFGQGSSFDVVALSRSLKGKDWRQALHRFDAFCEARGQPDLVAFNVLIRDAPWVMSVELMQDILPMRPDVVTISTVVKCCTENSVWLPSTRLLAFARQSSVEVDRVARNSLMFGFCQGQEWERSLEVAPTVADLYTKDGLVMAVARGLRWTLALCLRSESQIGHTALLGTFSKGEKWQLALDLLQSAGTCRSSADSQVCASALFALQGRWRRVLGLLPSRKVISPNLLEAALQACAAAMQRGQAARLFQQLSSPSITAFNALLAACGVGLLGSLARSDLVAYKARGSLQMSFGEPPYRLDQVLPEEQVLSRLQNYVQTGPAKEVNAMVSAVDLLEERDGWDACTEGAWQRRVRALQVAAVVKLQRGAPAGTCRSPGRALRLRNRILEQQHSLGKRGTELALEAGGSRACGQWALRARQRLRTELGSTARLKASGQMAYLAYHGALEGFEGVLGPGQLGRGRALLPIFVEHDRALHPERQALLMALAALKDQKANILWPTVSSVSKRQQRHRALGFSVDFQYFLRRSRNTRSFTLLHVQLPGHVTDSEFVLSQFLLVTDPSCLMRGSRSKCFGS
ncbi:unnamed protein product [Durusdinium trenchii]|uniref:Pentatricopeptide repeat-containing protein, chloroplastic n=1 Tax=Durusdinium trenchii TaxID=1381693 RepID=A0ABP0LFL0_9DINO